jgi:alkylation response protein AidB-like acyl-CoA dehydrogenase
MTSPRLEFPLPANEQAIVDAALDLAERERETLLGDAESAGRVPQRIMNEAAALGLMRIQVPTTHGGLGYSYGAKMRLAEVVSRHSMAFVFSLINTQNVAAKLVLDAPQLAGVWVPQLMKAECFGATALTEPHAGSDFTSIRTTATRTASGWRLDGEKTWITNAAFADVFITYAQTDSRAGWRGIASFAVDAHAPGFVRAEPLATFGARSIGTGGFRLDGYELTESQMVAAPGDAFKQAMGSINGARTYVAAMCCGMLAGAIDTATSYIRERQAFGAPLVSRQGLRWLLADMETDLAAAQHLTYHAARLVEAEDRGAVLAAAHAKKFAARTAERHLPACVQAMGANGLLSHHGLGHHIACAKVAGYVDGSTEIQNERIAAICLD